MTTDPQRPNWPDRSSRQYLLTQGFARNRAAIQRRGIIDTAERQKALRELDKAEMAAARDLTTDELRWALGMKVGFAAYLIQRLEAERLRPKGERPGQWVRDLVEDGVSWGLMHLTPLPFWCIKALIGN